MYLPPITPMPMQAPIAPRPMIKPHASATRATLVILFSPVIVNYFVLIPSSGTSRAQSITSEVMESLPMLRYHRRHDEFQAVGRRIAARVAPAQAHEPARPGI